MIALSEIGVSTTRAVAESRLQPFGDPEGAADGADVLAEDEDALVARHLLEQRLADRLEKRDLRHQPAAFASANGDRTISTLVGMNGSSPKSPRSTVAGSGSGASVASSDSASA